MAGVQTAKALMTAALEGRQAERTPCAPHWWGSYKYEALGLDGVCGAWKPGNALAPVYARFYEKLRPDWFHLHIGTPRWFDGAEIIRGKGASRLRIAPELRALKAADRYFSVGSREDERIVDFPDYLLGTRCDRPKVDLSSTRAVREYARRYIAMDVELIEAQGYADHVRALSERYGQEAFIAVHLPSPVCEIFDPFTGYTGFEAGLIALRESPEGMRALIEASYRLALPWARAYANAGAHAVAISESYISPDLAGPRAYPDFLLPVHREFFAEVKAMGILPILDFWGNVNPILSELAGAGASGLMVEESKKTFRLDAREIHDRIGDRVCVFGNLDTIGLLHDGTPEGISREVERQAAGAGRNFIIANGSPITPGTPIGNVAALISAGRET
jgi:hypothetical protein